jgi:multiple sugar transport system substrate-binding protein
MSRRSYAWLLLVAFALPTILGACKPSPAMEAPEGETVVFWHVWYSEPVKSGMQAVVDEFNATNEWGITVEALDQGNYSDVEDLMNAAIQSGDLPNLVVAYGNALANWHSVEVLADLNEYIDDPDWGFTDADKADFYPAAYNSTIAEDGTRFGFPISQSAEVLFYNSTWGQELGFDAPPASSEEFMEQACAATAANAEDDDPDNDGTGGYVLYAGASQVMAWLFAFGGDILNAEGTGYNTSSPELQAVAEFLKGIWDEGCAFPTESYPNPEFATRKALIVSSSTVGLPYQLAAFEDAGTTDEEWMFMPFPGPDGVAVNSYLQSVGMVKSTPEKQLATWLFLKYFTSPEGQAKWIEASAYYPTRASTNDLLEAYAAENPQWASGLQLVEYGEVEPALPSWATVRRDIQDSFAAILQGTLDQIPTILSDLDAAAAEAVEETQ